MTLSLHAPIIIAGGGPQGSRASITRIWGARPAMQLRLLHTEIFGAFTAPRAVLIRVLSRASCLFHHAARQLADCLQFAALSCPGSHDRNQTRKGTHDHGNFTRKHGRLKAHV